MVRGIVTRDYTVEEKVALDWFREVSVIRGKVQAHAESGDCSHNECKRCAVLFNMSVDNDKAFYGAEAYGDEDVWDDRD